MSRDHRYNPTPAEDIYTMDAANAWIEEMIATGQVSPDESTRDHLADFLASLRPDQLEILQRVLETYYMRDPMALQLDLEEGLALEDLERSYVERGRDLEF